MTPTEKILEKLSKIKAHADSAAAIGNEAEAQAFAGMLQQLLLKHKLEMSDLDYAKEMQQEEIIERHADTFWDPVKKQYQYVNYPDVEIVNRRVEWMERLANTIAHFNSCQFLVVPGRSYIIFVGHKSNVEICEYLFMTMARTAQKLSDSAAKKFRREWRALHGSGSTPGGYRESFLRGFINRLFERLRLERSQYDAQSTAIVRVNKEAIAVREYIDNKFKDKKPAKAHGSRMNWNDAGYEAGKALADSVRLDANAVKEGRPNQQIED